MTRWALVAAGLVLAAATGRAHAPTPAEVIATIAAPAEAGVTRAERDARNPRVLVVRVGPRWLELPREARVEGARRWREAWRHAVPGGVVAVLDERERVVVRYGAGGVVTAVGDAR